MISLYIVLTIGLLAILWPTYIDATAKRGAPFVPTEPKVVSKMLDMAKIRKGDVVYDLGSGDGRIVVAAALMGAKAVGIEISLFRFWYSQLWIRLLKLQGRARIFRKNLFKVDLREADIIFAFLSQETNDKLVKKFNKELKKGARVVSYAFTMPGWKRTLIDTHPSHKYGPIYLYIKKG